GGSVRFLGEPASPRTEALVAAGLVLVPETRALFPDMSVQDNLDLGTFARWRGGARGFGPDLDRVFALFPHLADRRRQLAGTLSGGERQMLALGRALMSDPRLLLLDEPSLGLAPAIVESLYETLARLNREGITLLLAEQSVELALEIASHAFVLQTGRTVLDGPAARLAEDPDVQRIYLGLETAGAAARGR
ncbi:MAG: ABC transporter ATP-binding protein, partial [Acetobacteraceae bacterium]